MKVKDEKKTKINKVRLETSTSPRWKDKKMEDYYLNSENLKKFKENSDL